MKKLFLLFLVLVMIVLSSVQSFAVWDDFPSNLKAGYNLRATVNNGNTFITLTDPYREGKLECKYKVENFLIFKNYRAIVNCRSNTAYSMAVLTIYSAEYTYSKVDRKDGIGPKLDHDTSQTSVPFGVQYYYEYDNQGAGHETHYLFYRIYNV